MAAVNVIRVKRKATDEPAEALVIALKRSKYGSDTESNEVFLKFATTLETEAEFARDHIQAAIAKRKLQRAEWGKNPKISGRFNQPLSLRLQALHKAQSQKRRQELLRSRRLILTHSFQNDTDRKPETGENATKAASETLDLFKLYDIIEENEEVKPKQLESHSDSSITCNGVPLVQTNLVDGKASGDYVYDVYYIADGHLDERFVDGTVCVQSCALTDELVHPDEEEEEPEEYYDDEDDSNDEDNWRNDYPDEDSDFEKERDYYRDYEFGELDDFKVLNKFKEFNIDEDRDGPAYAAYKVRALKDLKESEDSDSS